MQSLVNFPKESQASPGISFVFIQLLFLLNPAKEQAQIKVVLVGPTYPRSTGFQFTENIGEWLSFDYCFHHKNCQHICNLNLTR